MSGSAKTYADVAKGIPVCRICQQMTKKKIIWQNDNFLIFTVAKSAWPGHCIIVSKQHIPYQQIMTTATLMEELYIKIVPLLCAQLKQLLPCTSFDFVSRGHLPHCALQILPRREDGLVVDGYQDPQPQKALDMTIVSKHSIGIDAKLCALLNPPLISVSEPNLNPNPTPPPSNPAGNSDSEKKSEGSSCCIM